MGRKRSSWLRVNWVEVLVALVAIAIITLLFWKIVIQGEDLTTGLVHQLESLSILTGPGFFTA